MATDTGSRLISIITPVYNAAGYLPITIASVQNQSYSHFEWIIIDDGSTDTSGPICDAAADSDPRIHVLHRDNHGVSAARNTGLANCNGELILFLDADDHLPADSLSTIANSIAYHDLLIADHTDIDEYGHEIPSDRAFTNKTLSCDQAIMLLYTSREIGYQGYIGNKAFKACIIKDNGLTFNEDIEYNEDRLFILQYLRHCKDAVLICNKIYNYVHHSASKMGRISSTAFDPSMLTELDAFDIMKRQLASDKSEAYYYCCQNMLQSSARLAGFNIESNDIKKRLRQIILQNLKEILLHAKGKRYLKLKLIVIRDCIKMPFLSPVRGT